MSTLKISCLQLKARDIEAGEQALAEALRAIDAEAIHEPDLILLPECVYPAYYLQPWLECEDLPERLERALQKFCNRAAQWGVWLCVGLVEASAGQLYNSAYLIDREGRIKGKARKHLLWHFDSCWFSSGDEFPVFSLDTRAGHKVKAGMIICADGRVPEVCRSLAVQGVELVLDVTNWVANHRRSQGLSNIQSDHMMICRALENRIYIACANKVGMEKDSILYCGRSQIVSPDGAVLAMASSDQEETLRCQLDFSVHPAPGRLHPLEERRPELYGLLAEDCEPRIRTAAGAQSFGVAMVQMPLDQSNSLDKACRYVEIMERQSAQLIVLGEPLNTTWDSEKAVLAMGKTLRKKDTMVAFTAREVSGKNHYKTLFLVDSQGTIGYYRKVHLETHERDEFVAGECFPVWHCRGLTIGAMLGYEGLLPEIARLHMLQGAELVLWPRACSRDDLLSVGVTRAAENRIYVAMVDNLSAGVGISGLIDPGGQLIAPALTNQEQASLAISLPQLAHSKLVAPGTNIVTGRRPKTYHHLVK